MPGGTIPPFDCVPPPVQAFPAASVNFDEGFLMTLRRSVAWITCLSCLAAAPAAAQLPPPAPAEAAELGAVGIEVRGPVGDELVRVRRRLVRARRLDRLAQLVRVVDDRAGPRVAGVVRHRLAHLPHEVASQHLADRLVADVVDGVVDEHARLDVAVGVDVDELAAAGHAAADEPGLESGRPEAAESGARCFEKARARGVHGTRG